MSADLHTPTKNSSIQLLKELEQLNDEINHSQLTQKRTRHNSLLLPTKPRSTRFSFSPWRFSNPNEKNESTTQVDHDEDYPISENKGIWNWKPIRALSHIGKKKFTCLFSVQVVTVHNLPASVNGLRLSVCVRKSENKDGGVKTMPSRVLGSSADFDETLFIRCNVYYTSGSAGTNVKFLPRPFSIYVIAVDAKELDFGKGFYLDLTKLIQESVVKSTLDGTRIRQWDKSFSLLGKAKGGEVVLKLGFEIVDKDGGGTGIYSQVEGQKLVKKNRKYSFSFSRRHSRSSFNFNPSPRIDHEPAEMKMDRNDVLDFHVVEKGIETPDNRSVSSEVVKEVIEDHQSHFGRSTEIDSIALHIRALESLMVEDKTALQEQETSSQILDADEVELTKKYLDMLDDAEFKKSNSINYEEIHQVEESDEVLIPDLGKGLGCVIQTRNGGYLAAMNPLNTFVARNDPPKLAMQISKPMILQSNKTTGFELFQKMAAIGFEELTSKISSLMPIDELVGKTAEKIAFEGIASSIIQGRNKERAALSLACSVALAKSMATAMSTNRAERISNGIWNSISEEPLTIDEILPFSMQMIEKMAVDGLKIQVNVYDEDAPLVVSSINPKIVTDNGKVYDDILCSAMSIEDGIEMEMETETITMSVVVQLRDPVRQYEAVGGPMIALIHAKEAKKESLIEEKRYKVENLQVGGVKVRSSDKQNVAAMDWLVANGMVNGGKKGKKLGMKKGPNVNVMWSIWSRVIADMWLKSIRNPDVNFTS